MRDGLEGNRMVGEVDEACILEAVKNGLCGCSALGRGAVEEEREVYELGDVSCLHAIAVETRKSLLG